LLQITSNLPCRRTSLQFSQIRLTLARTFMAGLPLDHRRAAGEEIIVLAAVPISGKRRKQAEHPGRARTLGLASEEDTGKQSLVQYEHLFP
jgi:hypothetical protein